MAGRVANVANYQNPVRDYINAPYVESGKTGFYNMEQNEVLDQLSDESFNRRVEILEQLLITVRRNGGRLPYSEPLEIFNGLALALGDTNWDVRLKCIQLINEVIPQLGEKLDPCMSVILGRLIPNIGESKITVRRAVIQTLHVYMKYTSRVQGLLRAIVQYGLDNPDARVVKETVVALPMLFTPDFKDENFFDITNSLAKKLIEANVMDNLRDCALMTMDKIKNLVGEREFSTYIRKLATPLKKYYCELTGMELIDTDPSPAPTPRSSKHFSKSSRPENSVPITSRSQYGDYEFGIVPSQVMKQINDQENFKLRAQGAEELKTIIKELNNGELRDRLLPHMINFISFLNTLMDDSNFKITTVTLEILNILAEKLGSNVKQYLRPLANTLTKRMGDNKIVVRTAVMKVAIKLMQSYQPKYVLSELCENLQHKNSRIRQETINIIIASLLTFPSYDFDLPRICEVVAPTLTDSKRQVRQAALECLAVIAQAMGLGKLQPLVHAVDSVELSSEGEGVMSAVQARLARRQLPKLNAEGLVEYATPIPSSASSRTPVQNLGADVEWICAVGSGSARQISRNDTMELESVTSSSARSTPASADNTPAPRARFMSAGRNKLPWEEERDDRGYKPYSQSPNVSVDGPPKIRNTWSNDDVSMQDNSGKKPPKRRTTVMGIGSSEDQRQEKQEQQVTYSQMHMNKVRKQGQTSSRSSAGPDVDEYDRDFAEKNRPHVKPFLVHSGNNNKNNIEGSSPISPPPEEYWIVKEDESPVPLKPALARSATKRTQKKVPPITSQSDRFPSKEDDSDSAYAASLGSNLAEDTHTEMMQYLSSLRYRNGSKMMKSLKGIRSSASKKKTHYQDRHSLSSRSRSPSPDMHESGIWSTSSSNQDSEYEGYTTRLKKSHKQEPVSDRTKPSQASSAERIDAPDSSSQSSTIRIDYNPISGVTFKENRNSDVQVVGRGYNDEGLQGDGRNNINGARKPKPRPQKGPLLSPLGLASIHSMGTIELDDDKVPDDGNFGVQGRGMFDSSSATEHAITVGNSPSSDHYDKRGSFKIERRDMPNAVVGISMNKQGSPDDPSLEDMDLMDDDQVKGMSKAMRDRIQQKKKQKEEDDERRRRENEKKQAEHEEKLKKERERQQEKLRRLNTTESMGIEALSISGSGSNTPKARPSPTLSPRKKTKPQVNGTSSQSLSASTPHAVIESDNPEDWKPFKDPEAAMREAQKNLQQEEWDIKCSGINTVRRLCVYHPNVVSAQLHTVVVAMLGEVKNLRSQVSRLAIVCIGDMFNTLKRQMDADVDMCAKVLLHKGGESNGFIREDVEKSLAAMIDNLTSQRVLIALLQGGASHKNVLVRKTTAYFLVDLVEKMGPGRILSGVKDITDKVLPVAAQFASDSSPETRYNGRKIMHMLMAHPDFDRMLDKHIPQNLSRSVKEIIENLRNKGLGENPGESSSARGRRSGPSSRAGSMVRGNSASSENVSSPKKLVRTDDATQEEIKQMLAAIGASDWKERNAGISKLLEMCESQTHIVQAYIVKIFDKFVGRLQDPNSKVNLYALQVFCQIIPLLSNSLATVLNMAVGNVAPNLSSKNKEIHTAAMDVIDMLMEKVDGALLLQPLANQAQSASARSKPDLVEKVAELVGRVYTRKTKQVILHVLPLLWHLLGATNSSGAVPGGSSNIRTATGHLVRALYMHMGSSLMERATQDPGVTPRHLSLLNDLIEK